MYTPKLAKDIRNPLEAGLACVSGKWKTRIICALMNGGPMRYKQVKANLSGVTDAVLAQTLKELTTDEIVARTQYDEMPVRVEYALTVKGQAAIPMLQGIARWTQAYNPEWAQVRCGCGRPDCLFDQPREH